MDYDRIDIIKDVVENGKSVQSCSQFVLHNKKLYALKEIPERQKSTKLIDFDYTLIPAKAKNNTPAFMDDFGDIIAFA